jgi:NTE family protein
MEFKKGEGVLRKPLGLALSGGGAHGAWQAGALLELSRAGLEFSAISGFSAGALNGSAYALGLREELVERWLAINGNMLHLSPRFFPTSWFSNRPIRDQIHFANDDAMAQKTMQCPLTVISSLYDRTARIYAGFKPGTSWDGPLAAHLLASCTIPKAFPPVSLRFRDSQVRLQDGGVSCAEPLRFEGLEGCADVLLLEMAREEELTRQGETFFERIEQPFRARVRKCCDEGTATLKAGGARVFRLPPSRRFSFSMLGFRGAYMSDAVKMGAADARNFLADPLRHLV